MTVPPALEPFDALLVVSFGGPEGPDDVVPFLENVTRGRGIPRERLAEVGRHYFDRGGRSPINDQCRALIAALQQDLRAHDLELPVYWGNRNWDPFLADAFATMTADHVRRAVVFVTSAYASYSGCRQYREDLFDAAEAAGATGSIGLDKLRHYFNVPGFVEAFVDRTEGALGSLPDDVRDGARLVFVTHSIPAAMAASSGPGGDAYVAQHLSAAEAVAHGVARRTGIRHTWDLAYCSRSGSPHMPWLEPDVNDHVEKLASDGVPAAVVVPVGFVSDHMEVLYDLDTEAAATAARLGLPFARAGTPGTHPAFVGAIRELILERAAAERGEAVERATVGSLGASWEVCAHDCCANQRGPRPALCELPGTQRAS
jgi:ferrochelatase